MSSVEQKKGPSDINTKKCGVCATYQRKIDEIEQSLSGRDNIITLLQTQLKKCETNYKQLFDDYEKLRYQHCTALQDNFSLKEINEKLEELSIKDTRSLKNSSSQCEQQINSIQNRSSCQESKNPVFREVNKIESLISTQNQILKQLLDKIINELKFCKCDNPDIVHNISKIEEEFRNIESGDHLDTDPNINELLEQVETLKTLLDDYKRENDCMKQLLQDKKNSLSECQNILQDTSVNISKISHSIDDLVKDNSLQKKSKDIFSDQIEKNSKSSNMEVQKYKTKVSTLESKMKQKEKEYDICKCEMIGQMTDLSDNNQLLSDTLDVMKAENMNNLATVAQLKEELKRVNEECEKNHGNMKSRIVELENELEASKINQREQRKSTETNENESKKLKERIKYMIDENSKIQECKCDAENELKKKIAMLERTNVEMRRDLTEKTLELSEYEEENMALSQKIGTLTKRNDDLQERIRELEDQLEEKTRGAEKYGMGTQMSADFSTNDLKNQVKQLDEGNQCCNNTQKEADKKLSDIETLKNSIRMQISEIDQLCRENADLKSQLERLKKENRKETEKLQSLVNHSQKQVELLLKEHDEKTAQIQSVANELDGIRNSVNEENINFVTKIEQLEQERDKLKSIVEDYEANKKECKCEDGRFEIEKLKAEIIKKQCVILELEKTLDNFNTTVNQLDQNIEDMACENACIKDDRDKRVKELETLQDKLREKIAETEELRKQLENSELAYQNSIKQCKSLEMEIEKLKNETSKLKLEQANYKRCSETDKLELQMEIDGLKEEQSRKCSILSGQLENMRNACDELKNQCAKKCFESEKLREDLQNNMRLVEELKKTILLLRTENDKFKNQNRESIEEQYKLSEKIEDLKECYDRIKKECTLKCVENEDWRAKFEDQKSQLKDLDGIKKKLSEKERELSELNGKLNELQNDYDNKCQEFRKLKKQYESCYKYSQISRDEYNNLRKEYKEIKNMLSDQIKKYKKDVDSTEGSQASPKSCKIVYQLKQQLLEKESELISLHQKLKDASYEIIEMKDYIHKLISDNNILKTAINSLIGNLERKIKGTSFGSLPAYSADAIAGEILQSLTNIESTIIKKSKSICLGRCPEKDCDCMSTIQSQYNMTEPEQGPSKSFDLSKVATCCQKLNQNVKDPARTNRSVSQPSTNIGSEPTTTTTDSDDCHCAQFLDKKSVEFLKDAIKCLKTSKDNTMKEKSCDCEEYGRKLK